MDAAAINISRKQGSLLIPLKVTDEVRHGKKLTLCRCKGCNQQVKIPTQRVGRTKTCRQCAYWSRSYDLKGVRSGKLIALQHERYKGKMMWRCICDCGKVVYVRGNKIKAGKAKGCGTCIQSDWPDIRLAKWVYYSYKSRIKRQKKVFALTLEDVHQIIYSRCFYCGALPNNNGRHVAHIDFYYNGIDRVDNSKGYEIRNVVPCCICCNQAKNDLSQEEFIQLAAKIVKCAFNRTKVEAA